MSIFTPKKKAPAEPTSNSGTAKLRRLLISRTRHRTLAAIASDVNDLIVEQANRTIAHGMASRMVGDNASPAAVASLARTLASGFGNDVNRETREVTESALRAFIDGERDLPVSAKNWLVCYMSGRHMIYDSERDEIVRADANAKIASYSHPARWINPDPRVAAAQRAYHEALVAAQPPRP